MIRRYCDRCGREIHEIPSYIQCQTQYVGGKFEIDIFRNPMRITEPKRRVDLCIDCKNTLEKIIDKYLTDLEDVGCDQEVND